MTPSSLVVRGSPQEFECRPSAWSGLERHLNRRNIRCVLVLHGDTSWKAAKPFFPEMPSVVQTFMFYGKQCTDKQICHVARFVKENGIQGVIAVGGGKVSDLAKAAAASTFVPVIILPTLASTCAAWTPLSVIYREDGSMDRYDIYQVANALVLIDPFVILKSPMKLMIAGIGDTLAKWYEADCIISQLSVKPICVQIAAHVALKCRDVLLSDSKGALQAMKESRVNQEFLNVVETNIMLGGMVGGFGDEFGRTSGAHAIHDGFTILPKSHKILHGYLVAYSILVQLSIENNWEEINKLFSFYRSLKLPVCLADLNLSDVTQCDLHKVAKCATEKSRSIHLMKGTIDAKVVEDAIQRLEDYVAKVFPHVQSSL